MSAFDTRHEDEDQMLPQISQFLHCLQQDVHIALEYRTPHRYTSLFRFAGDTRHNEVLYDRNQPGVRQGLDVPLVETYCALVGQQQGPVSILDAALDLQAQGVDTTVISYCGVLIRAAQGQPYGTLCHYRYAALPGA